MQVGVGIDSHMGPGLSLDTVLCVEDLHCGDDCSGHVMIPLMSRGHQQQGIDLNPEGIRKGSPPEGEGGPGCETSFWMDMRMMLMALSQGLAARLCAGGRSSTQWLCSLGRTGPGRGKI